MAASCAEELRSKYKEVKEHIDRVREETRKRLERIRSGEILAEILAEGARWGKLIVLSLVFAFFAVFLALYISLHGLTSSTLSITILAITIAALSVVLIAIVLREALLLAGVPVQVYELRRFLENELGNIAMKGEELKNTTIKCHDELRGKITNYKKDLGTLKSKRDECCELYDNLYEEVVDLENVLNECSKRLGGLRYRVQDYEYYGGTQHVNGKLKGLDNKLSTLREAVQRIKGSRGSGECGLAKKYDDAEGVLGDAEGLLNEWKKGVEEWLNGLRKLPEELPGVSRLVWLPLLIVLLTLAVMVGFLLESRVKLLAVLFEALIPTGVFEGLSQEVFVRAAIVTVPYALSIITTYLMQRRVSKAKQRYEELVVQQLSLPPGLGDLPSSSNYNIPDPNDVASLSSIARGLGLSSVRHPSRIIMKLLDDLNKELDDLEKKVNRIANYRQKVQECKEYYQEIDGKVEELREAWETVKNAFR